MTLIDIVARARFGKINKPSGWVAVVVIPCSFWCKLVTCCVAELHEVCSFVHFLAHLPCYRAIAKAGC